MIIIRYRFCSLPFLMILLFFSEASKDCTSEVIASIKSILGHKFKMPKNSNPVKISKVKAEVKGTSCIRTGTFSTWDFNMTYGSIYCTVNPGRNIVQQAVRAWLKYPYKYPGEKANPKSQNACASENNLKHNLFLRIAGKNSKSLFCAKTDNNKAIRCNFLQKKNFITMKTTSELFSDKLFCKYDKIAALTGLGTCSNYKVNCNNIKKSMKKFRRNWRFL